MLPKGLLLTNKVLLTVSALAIAYSYFGSPPTSIARGIGQLIPLAVLVLTIVAATRASKRMALSALVANGIVCLIASVGFLFLVGTGSIGAGVAIIVFFIPFFLNAYFLFRYKPVPNAL